jgi:hypothetical protein
MREVVQRKKARMVLSLLGVVVLLQCKGLTPVTSPPVTANRSACGLRFWLPQNWTLKVKEAQLQCKVGLLAPDWHRDHPDNDYSIYFSVSVREADTRSLGAGSASEMPGFYHDDRGWHANGSVGAAAGRTAWEIGGRGWRGLRDSIQFSSYARDGHYQGVGEGSVAAIVGPRGKLVYAVANGVWALQTFTDVLCSLEFVKSPNDQLSRRAPR